MTGVGRERYLLLVTKTERFRTLMSKPHPSAEAVGEIAELSRRGPFERGQGRRQDRGG